MIPKITPINYKREKNKIEIKGDPRDVRWIIVFDLVTSRFLGLAITIFLLVTIPKTTLIPVFLKWLKGTMGF